MEADQFDVLIASLNGIGSGGNSWAVGISAVAITGAAIFAWIWQRGGIARRTLTFKTLEEQMWDKDFIEQRKIFVGLRENHGSSDLEDFAKEENDDDDKAQSIRIILNNYELMCIGIKQGVLDEEMIRQYHRSTWVKDYERMKPYIAAVRKKTAFKGLMLSTKNSTRSGE